MLDEATSFDVQRMVECRSRGITQRLWQDPLPGGHDPCALFGEETFYPEEGSPVSMAMTCVEAVEGTGEDRHFTYPCPYCRLKHQRKAGRKLGGCFMVECGLGMVSCTDTDLDE